MNDERDQLSRYSDQEIEDAFNAGFQRKAAMNYLESFDVTSETNDAGVKEVVVGIASMANSPTKAQFEEIPEFKSVVAKFDYDRAEIPFVLSEVVTLNSMEFQAVYVQGEPEADEETEAAVDAEAPAEDVAATSDLTGSSETPAE